MSISKEDPQRSISSAARCPQSWILRVSMSWFKYFADAMVRWQYWSVDLFPTQMRTISYTFAIGVSPCANTVHADNTTNFWKLARARAVDAEDNLIEVVRAYKELR